MPSGFVLDATSNTATLGSNVFIFSGSAITGNCITSIGTTTVIAPKEGHVLNPPEGATFIGASAGYLSVPGGSNSTAIGFEAGYSNQGEQSMAIGVRAGRQTQGSNSTAIGYQAGNLNQGRNSVAIGPNAGGISQQQDTVAIGSAAGANSQGENSIAIGPVCGEFSQGLACTAIGRLAARFSQGTNSVAIGNAAGTSNQGAQSVTIGTTSGEVSQGQFNAAIGIISGQSNQGTRSTALGFSSARFSQGTDALALGYLAGETNQHNNSIILNSSGNALNSVATDSLYIKNIRSLTSQGNASSSYLRWDASTGEVSWNASFTASHQCKSSGPKPSKPGLLVDSTGSLCSLVMASGSKTKTIFDPVTLEKQIVPSNAWEVVTTSNVGIDQAVPVVTLTQTAMSKKVLGVYSKTTVLNDGSEWLHINSLGEGGIWVSNVNGNIVNGDYLTSSSDAGHAQKQDDDLLHSYTVGKATMDCDFDLASTRYTCIEEDGTKRAFISCTYHSG